MGYEDPRLSVYFLPMDGNASYGVEAFDGKTYQAVPAGHANAQNDIKILLKAQYSKWNSYILAACIGSLFFACGSSFSVGRFRQCGFMV